MSAPAESRQANFRQYALAAVFALMVLYFVGEWALENLLQGPIEEARSQTERLQDAIRKREKALAQARKAAKLLAAWEEQSLPADLEVARSLYQGWLVELVNGVKLANPSVNSSEPVSRKGLYYALGFSVRGRGTLEQLTKFLFAFYRTDLLHQIRSLTIMPLGQSGQLDVSIAIEAVALPGAVPEVPKGATAEDVQRLMYEQFRQRTWRAADRLAFGTLTDYAPIVTRNLFTIGGNEPDPIDQTYLTSVAAVNGEEEAWFTVRTTDELLKLRKGDRLQVGQFSGTIAEIAGGDVILESEGERWLLTLGESLADAFALPPER